MEKLRLSHGVQRIDRAMTFLTVRLRSVPMTDSIARPVEEARKNLLEGDRTWHQAQAERLAATAEIAYHDHQLNESLRAVAQAIADLTNRDPNNPCYAALQPNVQAEAGDKEPPPSFMSTLIGAIERHESLSSLSGHAPILRSHLMALDRAVAHRDQLYQPEARAHATQAAALERAIRVYNLAYPQLQLLLPAHADLVESLFMPLGSDDFIPSDMIAGATPVTAVPHASHAKGSGGGCG